MDGDQGGEACDGAARVERGEAFEQAGAAEMFFGCGAQPNDAAVAAEDVEDGGGGGDGAGVGDDGGFGDGEEVFDGVARVAADGLPDGGVEFDQGDAAASGDGAADCSFAGGLDADERDPVVAVGGALGGEVAGQQGVGGVEFGGVEAGSKGVEGGGGAFLDEIEGGGAEAASDGAQDEEGDVAFADLDLEDVALGSAGLLGEEAAAHAAAFARRQDALADGAQEGGVVEFGAGGGVGARGADGGEEAIDVVGSGAPGHSVLCKCQGGGCHWLIGGGLTRAGDR